MGSYDYEDYSEDLDHKSHASFFKPMPKAAKSLLPATGVGGKSGTSTATPSSSSPTVAGAPKKTKLWLKHVKPVDEVEPPKSATLNVIFAFDVTRSMEMYIGNVRQKMRYMCSELLRLVPDMEISFIGVGDHQDGEFLLQATDFSNDLGVLREKIDAIQMVSGGDDHPEAFECLFKAVNEMGLAGTNTIMFLVTDSIPHGMGYRGLDEGCPLKVDYRKELQRLHGGTLRGLYIMGASPYREIIKLQKKLVASPDHFLPLSNYRRVVNIASAVVAAETGQLEKFCKKLGEDRGEDRVRVVLKTLGKPLGVFGEKAATLDLVCPSCGVENVPGSILCSTCGAPLPVYSPRTTGGGGKVKKGAGKKKGKK
ncbi:MAG: hypothetical protein ACTSU5_18730 [Promethearchaeota archaeon]